MARINIPNLLREFTDNRDNLLIKASTLKEGVKDLGKTYPELENKLCDNQGEIRKYIKFCLNQKPMNFSEYESYHLKDEDEISIIIPLAGG